MMTKDSATREEMKAVERWENEGGSVSPLNSLWEPLKNFRTEDKPREGEVIEGGMIVSRSSRARDAE